MIAFEIVAKSALALASLAEEVALLKDTKTKPVKMPMMAITTRSSIRVKALRFIKIIISK
jgi:hypothetical protein